MADIIETTETNYDDVPLEDLRASIATGQVPTAAVAAPAPETVTDPLEAPVAEPAADSSSAVDPAQEPPAEAPVEDPAKEAAPVNDVLEKVTHFKFTDNADAETLEREEAEYLELVELSPQVQAMLDRRTAQITELQAAVPATAAEVDAIQQEHNAAFDGLVTFRKTEEGEYVPDTQPLRSLLRDRYPNESEQLVTDLLVEPSVKYSGYTRYMEYMRDMAGLNDEGISTLESFLESGGKMPFPSYTPPGIDPKVGEAYWNSPDRDVISERVDRANHIINDPRAAEDEVASAKADLQKLNNSLNAIQKGMNADAKEHDLTQQSNTTARDEIVRDGNAAYVQTTLGLLQQGQEGIAKGLATVFDDAGAKITAASFGMLINAALSDSTEYSKAAQKQLADQGIRIDWNQAGQALNRLYQQEQQIVALEKMKANSRAVENAKGDKNKIILDIKGFEKNLTGQILATLTKDAGSALKKTLANTPKIPAVRPRIGGDGSPIGTKPNYDDMPLDKLREVAFGRKPIESLEE